MERLEEAEARDAEEPSHDPFRQFAGAYSRFPAEHHSGTRVGFANAATLSSIVFGDDSPAMRGPARTTNQVHNTEMVDSYNAAKVRDYRKSQQEMAHEREQRAARQRALQQAQQAQQVVRLLCAACERASLELRRRARRGKGCQVPTRLGHLLDGLELGSTVDTLD